MAQQGQYPPTAAPPPPPPSSATLPPLQQQYTHHHQYIPQPLPPPHHHPTYHHQQLHLQQHHMPTMPYPHQYAHHHNPYAALPQMQPHYNSYYPPDRPSSKRPREPVADSGDGVPSTKRQAVVGNDVLFRVVVPSGQIGKVIGKGGHRVQKVREDSKANVKIADPIARFEERVIIISSKEKSDGGMTDAENALLQIASLILADDGSNSQALSMSAAAATLDPYGAAAGISAGHVANTVKLLIAGSQAGGLIGVSGQNIEKLRNSSGALIAVLAPNQLPLCASAHESDRLVQISGEVPAVMKAVEEIGVELRANPPKQVISISPTYNVSIQRAAQQYMDPNAAEYVTLDMAISETMVGGFIGRSGSNISRIRTESGAMIKVVGGKGEQKLRQIQLIGTAQQVALAKQRVDEYIYTQLTQQPGAE